MEVFGKSFGIKLTRKHPARRGAEELGGLKKWQNSLKLGTEKAAFVSKFEMIARMNFAGKIKDRKSVV